MTAPNSEQENFEELNSGEQEEFNEGQEPQEGEHNEPGESGNSGSEQPSVAELQASLRAAEQRAEQSQRMLEQLQVRMLDRDERAEPNKVEEEEAATDLLSEMSEEQLGALTNKQLLELASKMSVQAMSAVVQKKILPKIEDRLNNLGTSVEEERARRDVATTASKYNDFWSYKQSMLALSQEPRYANLGAEDLYHLAKSRISTGPGNLSGRKVNNPTGGQRRSAKASSEKPVTMGGGTQGADKKGEMTPEQAADDAWNKVFGNKTAA